VGANVEKGRRLEHACSIKTKEWVNLLTKQGGTAGIRFSSLWYLFTTRTRVFYFCRTKIKEDFRRKK
jgi:hypothetical protein